MTLFAEIESKPFEYLALAVILLAGLVAYFAVSFEPHYQRNVVYAASTAYFFWSLYHHYRRGDLHLSIVIEYLVFILLGLIILSSTFVF